MKKMQSKFAFALAAGCALMLSGVSAVSAGKPDKNDQGANKGSMTFTLARARITIAADLSVAGDGMYIVRLSDRPIATYDGGIRGLAPTSAQATGRNRLDTNSPAARAYQRYLQDRQQAVLASAERAFGRGVVPTFQYQHALNGFAVELTGEEAKKLSLMDGVAAVQKERMEQLLTDAGPAWIGAPEIWENGRASTMGEGVVVAILDTGINNDHPSFADIGGDGYDHTNPLGSGNYIPDSYCDEFIEPDGPGILDPVSFCNDKLIGAWSFVVEAITPNDSDGHGSHTASTVAGNAGPAYVVAPTLPPFTPWASGVAPHANIIAYDVCVGDGCPSSALIAAINQVLIDAGNLPDGIAALNYSISGGGDPYNDPVELGFLAAVQAGVYVSASAGNSGPAPGTVAHLGPWVSTTAASTHNRTYPKILFDMSSDGDGKYGMPQDVYGAGATTGYGPAPIVHANSTAFDPAGQCLNPFPAGTWTNGEIVVCDRGEIARVEKGFNVLAGGAGGFILANMPVNGESIMGDTHFLPAIHIGAADGNWIRTWLAGNSNTMGTLSAFVTSLDPADGDIMASFSSRGPQQAFDVLKPDISAPGVNILAAIADGGAPSPEWGYLSGTSMSSPHNAGAGALMTAMRPNLTAQEIKSAIMMTAESRLMAKEDGTTPADPFDMGAGRISLGDAKNANLVMSETTRNFLAANPDEGGDPSTLNLASMMNSNCVGSCAWERTLTNPGRRAQGWDLSTTSPPGVVLEVEVAGGGTNLLLGPRASDSIRVTADTTLASEGWHFGTVNMVVNTYKGPDLHLPVAVYASRASNPEVFVKTVDKTTAAPGDTLTYELSVTNGPHSGTITVEDVLPPGATLVPGSETEVIIDGATSTPWSFAGSVGTWQGELATGGLDAYAGLVTNYVSLAGLGVPPFALPGGCDDGGWILDVPSFTYNGASYSQLIWSVNGTVEAGAASSQAASWVNTDMPDAAPPNNLIAPFWDDLRLCESGNWYVAVLGSGPYQWLVLEWEDVPHWFSGPDAATFQVWIPTNASAPGFPMAHFTYGRLDRVSPSATVGAENATGTDGASYYYNGAGTAPAVGTDVIVEVVPGGTATLGFQVTTDCSSTPVVNEGTLSSGVGSENAIAVTTCSGELGGKK